MNLEDLTPALVLGTTLLLPKAQPPCAARVECEVEGTSARCSPRLVRPDLCDARGLDVTTVFERVVESTDDYRVRLTMRDAETGRVVASPLAYLVRDGGTFSLTTDHPAIVARPVPVHAVRFDGVSPSAAAATAAGSTVFGRIVYQDFPVRLGGYRAPILRPVRGVDVTVQSVGASPPLSVSARTDSNGVFRASIGAIGDRVAVTFFARSSAAVVEDNLSTVYSWTTAGSPATVTADPTDLGTVQVDEAHDSGALNILDVVQSGFDYATSRGAPAPPEVTVEWKKGLLGAGTFYDPSAMRIHLLSSGSGANDDTDEWDDQVIAHEYGHHIQATTSCNLSAGGPWAICDVVAPELAWSEGSANYLSLVVSTQEPAVDHDGALYLDLVGSFAAGSHTVLSWDLEASSCSGLGPRVPGVVSNFLWDLQDEAGAPPDTFFRSETDLFRLLLDLRGESRCDVDELLVEMCRRDPKDLDLLGDLFRSYGLDRPTGCELPVRGPVPPPSRHRRTPGVAPPRSGAGLD